jgi:glycosyltransferase involved in cell wall biosynthesis
VNKKSDLLTVLLITYNHEKWIAKAIESVLEQETNFSFIIKIFDDFSTDNSANIAKQYESKYPNKIQLILENKNIGVGKNFKKAFQNTDTKYFCFLESDDYWCDKTKLQSQVDILEKNPEFSMCGHNTKIYNFKTQKESYICNDGIFSNGFNSNNQDCIFSFEEAPYIHTSSRMYRNKLVDFSVEPDWLCVDINHYYKFLSKGSIYYINKVMSIYNVTGVGDYSKFNQLEKDLQYFNVLFKLNKYFNYRYNEFYTKKICKNINKSKFKYSCFFCVIWINIKYKFKMMFLKHK